MHFPRGAKHAGRGRAVAGRPPLIAGRLAELGESFDLAEPFGRIREAIAEASRPRDDRHQLVRPAAPGGH